MAARLLRVKYTPHPPHPSSDFTTICGRNDMHDEESKYLAAYLA